MNTAIIGGTGFYSLEGHQLKKDIVETPFGQADIFSLEGDLDDVFFLPRHGASHSIPPHRINFRANIKALQQLGVERVLATCAVGSINETMPPGSLVIVDQFLDFTHGRAHTFFNGGESGVSHVDATEPYCCNLSEHLYNSGLKRGLTISPKGTYVCCNGPRLETAAEIRMFGLLGADIVGMTGVPEVVLARELGIHYAAIAISINWAAGLNEGPISYEYSGFQRIRLELLPLLLETLHSPFENPCGCNRAPGA